MLVEHANITVPSAAHGDMKAFDDLTGAILKHAPGLQLAVEIVTQLQAWQLLGVITYLRTGTAH